MLLPRCRGRVVSALRHWLSSVSDAAAAFESRWTMRALARVDADLSRRLSEQRSFWDAACVTGTDDDIALQGGGMVRGYAAAVRALAAAGTEDDAYMLGSCSRTGCRVAIGHQRAAVDRVRELHGDRVIWITPDEVAALMASVEAFKFVGAVKQLFPGAETIDRYPDQPALNG